MHLWTGENLLFSTTMKSFRDTSLDKIICKALQALAQIYSDHTSAIGRKIFWARYSQLRQGKGFLKEPRKSWLEETVGYLTLFILLRVAQYVKLSYKMLFFIGISIFSSSCVFLQYLLHNLRFKICSKNTYESWGKCRRV